MKKTLLSILCTLCVGGHALFANAKSDGELSMPPAVRSSFGYVDMGLGPFPLPIPSFGIGCRSQNGHNGFDSSLHVSTIIYMTQLKGSLLYHYYPKPCLCSQFYFGAGVGVGALFDEDMKINECSYLVSPEFVVGKNYLTDTGGKRFFQAQVSWPTIAPDKFTLREFSSSDTLYYPLVTFSYGIGF